MNADDVVRGERRATLITQGEPAQSAPGQAGSDRGDPARKIERHSLSGPGSITLMLLRLGTRWFGMDVRSIEEVALKGTVTRVPMSPSHILGVTILRGRLVTVVGLEQMLGGDGMLSHESTATLPRLVVVRDGDYEMAIVAEGIHGMTEYVPAAETDPDRCRGDSSASSASHVPNDAESAIPEFVREEFDWHGNWVSLLDASLLIATAARLAGILSPSEEVDT
jgi:chemotaxis signal transduction protein